MPITLSRIEAYYYRAPIKEHIITSFGVIPARTVLLLRVEDQDGAHGWGEVWANFPPVGAENKLRLLEAVIAPTALGRTYDSPVVAWLELSARMRRNVLQSAEPGNFGAILAGLDVALWDLTARKQSLPLWRALGLATKPEPLFAYASNLNPGGAPETVDRCRAHGYRGFKMKVAFDFASDLDNVKRISASLRPGECFMIDANQGYDMPAARQAVAAFGEFPLQWIEEPICADEPTAYWAELAMLSRVPLAAGENLLGFAQFDAAIAAGRRYCPHWLNSGLGLFAAAHLLGAVGGDGMLEHDAMKNSLQAVLAQPFPPLVDGRFALTDSLGLGVQPDLSGARTFLIAHRDMRKE